MLDVSDSNEQAVFMDVSDSNEQAVFMDICDDTPVTVIHEACSISVDVPGHLRGSAAGPCDRYELADMYMVVYRGPMVSQPLRGTVALEEQGTTCATG